MGSKSEKSDGITQALTGVRSVTALYLRFSTSRLLILVFSSRFSPHHSMMLSPPEETQFDRTKDHTYHPDDIRTKGDQ